MSESQGPGGGALETHHFGGFGPPPSSGKDPFCPTSTNGGHHHHAHHGLTDISGDTHLTLLKSNSGLNSFSSFADSDGLGSRLPDAFMEMRYIELGNWDLTGYTAEGLTARLIDNRSLTDSPDNIIQYRPWEKPDSSSPNTLGTTTTTSSPSHLILTSNGNGIMTSSTSNGKSPTLTTLTNAFPTFSDTFGPSNGQKSLPSFQSQFNSFNEPSPTHPNNNHHGNNGDIINHHPVTTAGPPVLPSFHTLPANHRGYVHQGQPTLLTSAPLHRDLPNIQQPFIDDRHIQLFPGQILTTGGPPVTNPGLQTSNNGQHFVTSTNNLCGPPGHHFAPAPPQHLVELVSMPPMQLHGHYPHPPAHPHAKLQPQSTDGSIPGLNLNDLHHHTQNNGNLNLSLNVPPSVPGGKYVTNDGPIETLIAVKIQPSPHGNNFDHQQHPQLNNHPMHHHHLQQQQQQQHHQMSNKMDQQQQQQHTPQNSPQIVTNSTTNGNGIINHHQHNNNNNNHNTNNNGTTPKRQQKRKRNTIETMDNNSYQQQHHNNNHHQHNNNVSHNNNDLNNDAQVSSVSSSDSDFKRPNLGLNGNGLDDSGLDKPVKKKRKRCGECVGCQRKDNCGDCAPCRNDKSHQICKMRRCEKLTEKKNRVGRAMK